MNTQAGVHSETSLAQAVSAQQANVLLGWFYPRCFKSHKESFKDFSSSKSLGGCFRLRVSVRPRKRLHAPVPLSGPVSTEIPYTIIITASFHESANIYSRDVKWLSSDDVSFTQSCCSKTYFTKWWAAGWQGHRPAAGLLELGPHPSSCDVT